MAPRRSADRPPLTSRSYREPMGRGADRTVSGVDPWEQRSRRTERRDSPRFQSELDRDFAAMKRVWQMIRSGAVRMVGEVGRQY